MNHQLIEPWTRHFLEWYATIPWKGTLLSLMGLDIATGMIAAFVKKSLSSNVSFYGMCRKAIVILFVAAAKMMENVSGEIGFAALVCGAFCITEFLSIAENAKRAGVWLPEPVSSALDKVKSYNFQERRKAAVALVPTVNVANAESVNVDAQTVQVKKMTDTAGP